MEGRGLDPLLPLPQWLSRASTSNDAPIRQA